jgi:pyridoxine 4-dehydrogenase
MSISVPTHRRNFMKGMGVTFGSLCTVGCGEHLGPPARGSGSTGAPPNAGSAGTISLADMTVNRMGFGAMRITGPGIWGPPKNLLESKKTLRRAVELGVNFIDTADAYGPDVSEQLIFEALSPYPRDLVIATKGGLTRPGPDVWKPDGRPEHLRAACEGSLRRLHLERIGLYQFHMPDPNVPIEESIGEFERLRLEGKIRHIGVSNVDLAELKRARAVAPIVSVQNRFNIDDRSSEDVLRYCEGQGLAFIPWGPLSVRRLRFRFWPTAVTQVALEHSVSAARVDLAWLLAYSKALLPIPGTANVAHLEDDLAAVTMHLTPADMKRLG